MGVMLCFAIEKNIIMETWVNRMLSRGRCKCSTRAYIRSGRLMPNGYICCICLGAIVALVVIGLRGGCSNIFVSMITSLVAASIFYFFSDYLPDLKRRTNGRKIVEICFSDIRKSFYNVFRCVSPFWFDSSPLEKFVERFKNCDLYEKYPPYSDVTKVEFINQELDTIKKVSETIIGTYGDLLSKIELDYIGKLQTSMVLRNRVWPRDFEKENICENYDYYSNQKEFAEELLVLYEDLRTLEE